MGQESETMSNKVVNLRHESYSLVLREVNALSSALSYLQSTLESLSRARQATSTKTTVKTLKQVESELQERLKIAKIKFERLG